MMKIGNPEVIKEDKSLLYRVDVSFSEGDQTLWYSLDADYADLVSERSDAALVALLIPAMASGEDIHLSGTISEKLYYNLSDTYQRVLQLIIPSLRFIKIYPSDVQPASQKAAGVASGFSAGIDSFSLLADHHYKKDVPTGFRVTHLIYNNVGSHGGGAERLFRERYARLKPFVEEQLGLPFIAINSNLNSFYKGYNFQQTHTPRNTSVALMLQGGIGRFMYASAYTYSDIRIGHNGCMAYSDSITLPLLSTEALDAFSVDSQYTRVEKTIRVADIEDSYKVLDVCVRDDQARNCSTCWKCMRTLLTLEIAGSIDRYSDIFDLKAYYQHRERYIAYKVLQVNDPLTHEITSFAKAREFKFPLSSRLIAYKSQVGNVIKTPVRKVYRKISNLIKPT
ncbi:hypothetical protein [Anabaena sp. CCY 0017]|uniref:hypothetical protein n=1 Tax=Anabaena sp. CCY 0017 TaxID=3103866 RepID=UPI0039C6816C